MSNSVRPDRRQPARLPHPWDSLGKNTGVSCHFLLQCMKVKSQSEVTQSCPTLRDPMDCSLPGSSVHGIFQARVLEWGAIALSNIMAQYSGISVSIDSTSMQQVLSFNHSWLNPWMQNPQILTILNCTGLSKNSPNAVSNNTP